MNERSSTRFQIPAIELSLLCSSLGLILFGTGWVFFTRLQLKESFYPEVYIDRVLISGKTTSEVAQALEKSNETISERKTFLFQVDQVSISTPAASLNLKKEYKKTVDDAFSVGHQNFFWDGLTRLLLNNPSKREFFTTQSFDPEKLSQLLAQLKGRLNTPAIYPKSTLGRTGQPATVKIETGKNGKELLVERAVEKIQKDLNSNQTTFVLETTPLEVQLNQDQVLQAKARATKLVGKQLSVVVSDVKKKLSDQEIIALLQLPTGIKEKELKTLSQTWSEQISRPAIEPIFVYDKKTLKVSSFTPPQTGLGVDAPTISDNILSAIQELEKTDLKEKEVVISARETQPKTSLESTNDLGVVSQIGFGDSEYFHSIPGRIHNVDITATRINNTLVAPGQEFSFNKTLGEVSAATGYQPAYVIKDGRTELGDGGGVCQVSTTVFRAVLNAGLPVTKRIAHSYRVSYYELNSKPGIDATVYAGEVDFRFKNDTGHYILIRTENNPKNLYLAVRLFGTSDGRSTEIVDHKTWDAVSAPPTRYQDDPTLPRGTTKQVDFAAGGIKTSFTNIVKDKSGAVLRRDTYLSIYKPWQAVFLVGTK